MPSQLYQQIYIITHSVPHGCVATYSDVAREAGLVNGARVVGWALRALPIDTTIPWQRIVAKGGRITILNLHHPQSEQKVRLESEGIVVTQHGEVYQIIDPLWHQFPGVLNP